MIPLLMAGVATATYPAQQQQKAVIIKNRRFVEDNGPYPVQAIAVDTAGANYPYIYSRSAVADSVANEELSNRLVALEQEHATLKQEFSALQQRFEDILRILSGSDGTTPPTGGSNPNQPDELTASFTTLVKENCQTCHSADNPSGDLTFFNDKGSLWIKKVKDDNTRDLTSREWSKMYRLVEIGKMPKGDKKLTAEQKDIVWKYTDKQQENLEGSNENPK